MILSVILQFVKCPYNSSISHVAIITVDGCNFVSSLKKGICRLKELTTESPWLRHPFVNSICYRTQSNSVLIKFSIGSNISSFIFSLSKKPVSMRFFSIILKVYWIEILVYILTISGGAILHPCFILIFCTAFVKSCWFLMLWLFEDE